MTTQPVAGVAQNGPRGLLTSRRTAKMEVGGGTPEQQAKTARSERVTALHGSEPEPAEDEREPEPEPEPA